MAYTRSLALSIGNWLEILDSQLIEKSCIIAVNRIQPYSYCAKTSKQAMAT